MFRKILLATAAVAALSTVASAADLPSRKNAPVYAPVAMAPIFTWTGFYVGANAGYGWAQDKYGLIAGSYFPNSDKARGAFVGGTAGYNYQLANNVVLGLEGDLAWADLKKSTQCAIGASCNTKIDALGTLRARIGYAFGNTLVYGTGGLAYANVKSSIFDTLTPAAYSVSKARWGYALGAGVEYALNHNWSIKGEYMYYGLGKKTYEYAPLEIARARNDIHTVKLGLNYRFGGYDTPVVAKY